GHMELLRKPAGSEWILTPHWGEFRRLVRDDTFEPADKVRLAARFAKEWGCVLIMKGMPSVVGCPDGRVYVNATGNPGLATAGTGDVLAGLLAGLLAQGLTPELAAVAGLHIGGAAADMYAESRDPRTMIATDLIELVPETVARRF
ncbi:MAG: NAD(P)H-hydrate dehydratase, partial [Rhodothermia bacterium]